LSDIPGEYEAHGNMNGLTVVIPTHNRCETLEKAIAAYLAQTEVKSILEILVVDDGSTDNTRDVVSRLSNGSAVPIRYFSQENKGPAAARNVGIREASSEVILFTDDDIIPRPALVAQHLAWHRKYPELSSAVLGFVTWAPEVKPTSFMSWYGSDGPLFAYAHFKGRIELDYRYFYTCNLSVKTEFLKRNGVFDEDFKTAAYEDTELGYRLASVGMRLVHNRDAVAYHWQHVSFDEACRRAKKASLAEEIFAKKEAGMHQRSIQRTRLPRSVKQAIKGILAVLLLPIKFLVDKEVGLPWSMYRLIFAVYR
jgi:glycosyltransferase involved in cell wall biosynthesis